MFVIPDAAVGAITAALVAAMVTLIGLIISKEQKTSEFRQAWIDAVRQDLSSYLTQINSIRDAIQIEYKDHAEKVEKLQPMYGLLNSATFNIFLRINSKEKMAEPLVKAMNEFHKIMQIEHDLTIDNLRSIESRFIEAAQNLLKYEWRRVKKGEPTFRITRCLAASVIGIATLTVATRLIAGWINNPPPAHVPPISSGSTPNG